MIRQLLIEQKGKMKEKDLQKPQHLDTDSYQGPEELDSESVSGHQTGLEEDDDVAENALDMGLYPELEDEDEDVPSLNIAEQVRKAEKSRRGG